jgi:hypothetical protein
MSNKYPAVGDSVDILVGTKLRPGIITNAAGVDVRVGHTGETYTGISRLSGTSVWTSSGVATFKMKFESNDNMLLEDGNNMRFE